MTRFIVGELVSIRYGKHQGQQGTILKIQSADVYTVKVKDGPILFFSAKGLDQEMERLQEV